MTAPIAYLNRLMPTLRHRVRKRLPLFETPLFTGNAPLDVRLDDYKRAQRFSCLLSEAALGFVKMEFPCHCTIIEVEA